MAHDFSTPYTEKEMEGLKEIFRSLPTYTNEGYIKVSDNREFLERIGWARTDEQHAAYEKFWRVHFGGYIPMSELMDTFRVIHDQAALIKNRSAIYDTDGDGFISVDEFKQYMDSLWVIHEPRLKGVSYETFVLEADENKDGKVSCEEFAKWVKNKLK